MTAPATSAPTGVEFLTYYTAAQMLADLLRRVNQFSTICHYYIKCDRADDLEADIKQALLILNGDLDKSAGNAIRGGIIDTAGNAILPPGYEVAP